MASKSSTTQKFVPIKDIKDGVVTLQSGQMLMVLLASSINFALKSTDEQTAILRQFQAFLNTLDFDMQIYIQSRRLNIDPYIDQLRAREPEQDNDLMRIQLKEYMGFVKAFTSEVDIMSKNFFVVVPYSPFNVDLKSNFSSFLGQKPEVKKIDQRWQENRLQLEQRIAIVEQGLSRIGVRTVLLQNDELVELYYHIFNPSDTKTDVVLQQ